MFENENYVVRIVSTVALIGSIYVIVKIIKRESKKITKDSW